MKAPRSWPNSSLSISVEVTEPQSNTANGPLARAEASWTARARTSLPVPVSPISVIETSEGARRASSANTCCIEALAAIALPNAASAGTSSSASSSTVMRHEPKVMSAPAATTTSFTAAPPTYVPLVEPRSRRVSPSGPSSNSQ